MSKSAIEFLKHILDESSFILNSTKGVSREDLGRDEVLKRAIVRSLEIIGEAAKKVDIEFRDKYPQIEWRAMSRMRDKLIHDYFGIDYDIVWDVIQNKIPDLNEQLDLIVKSE